MDWINFQLLRHLCMIKPQFPQEQANTKKSLEDIK